MKVRLAIIGFVAVAAATPALAQSAWTVEFSGGSATPVSDIGSRLSTGWAVDVGAGYQFNGWLSLLGDFGYAGTSVPASVLQELSAPDGHGRILSVSLDPEIRFPLTNRLHGFLIGGIGWIHRAVALTTPTVQYYDYYDPFYGDLGPQAITTDQVLSSVTRNALGENFGGGVTFPLAVIGSDLFAAVRYYRAPTLPRTTAMIPVTFGIRWTSGRKP